MLKGSFVIERMISPFLMNSQVEEHEFFDMFENSFEVLIETEPSDWMFTYEDEKEVYHNQAKVN